MKVLANRYSFSPSTKQIFLSGFTTHITLEQLLLITNVTTNTIIYNFADPAAGGNIVNNVITLSADTTSMAGTDRLQIFLDDLFEPLFGVYQDATTYSPVTSVSAVPSLTGVNAPLTIDIQTGGALSTAAATGFDGCFLIQPSRGSTTPVGLQLCTGCHSPPAITILRI